jgi:hypothetical protein
MPWSNHARKKHIKYRFRFIRIWPLNPKVMDNKTKPSEVYIVVNFNNARNEKEYIIKNEVKNNLQWGEESTTIEFLHMVETDQHLTSKDPPIYRPENDQHYYVDMPQSLTMIEQQPTDIDVVNLNEGNHAMILKDYCKKLSYLQT